MSTSQLLYHHRDTSIVTGLYLNLHRLDTASLDLRVIRLINDDSAFVESFLGSMKNVKFLQGEPLVLASGDVNIRGQRYISPG